MCEVLLLLAMTKGGLSGSINECYFAGKKVSSTDSSILFMTICTSISRDLDKLCVVSAEVSKYTRPYLKKDKL